MPPEYDPEPRKRRGRGAVPKQLRAWVYRNRPRRRDPEPKYEWTGPRGARYYTKGMGYSRRYDPQARRLRGVFTRARGGTVLGKVARAAVSIAGGYLGELSGKAIWASQNKAKLSPIPNYDYMVHMQNPTNYATLLEGVVEAAVGGKGGLAEAAGHGTLGHFGGRLCDGSWQFTAQYLHGGVATEELAYKRGKTAPLVAIPLRY